MSEDRTFVIFPDMRVLCVDEARDLDVYLESRVLGVQGEGRVLEVCLP